MTDHFAYLTPEQAVLARQVGLYVSPGRPSASNMAVMTDESVSLVTKTDALGLDELLREAALAPASWWPSPYKSREAV